MPSITVRNIPQDVHVLIKKLAADNGRSKEAEVRAILSNAARQIKGDGLAHEIRDIFGNNLGDDLVLTRSTDGPREVVFE